MRPSRSLLLSCLLAVALVQAARAHDEPRQLLSLPEDDDETTTTREVSTTSTRETPTTTTAPPTTTSATTSAAEPTKPSSTVEPTTSAPDPTTTSDAQSTSAQPTETTTPQPETSQQVTTDEEGSTLTITHTNTPSASAPSSSTTSSDSTGDDDDSGLGTGSIVGIAVAGGVALLGVVAFVIWKFTRKRFNEFDDSEAIKWPELNAHGGAGGESHALPVHNTGRAGFDTGSDVALSRVPSQTGTNYSTADVAHDDPYAVPPLPHLNPGQPLPYRDDPNAAGYYDPYRGPVPQTFNEATAPQGSGWNHGAEAYPMAQMGRTSPGPAAALGAYDTGRASPSMAGHASPGPQMGLGRTLSPGPQMAYGRTSPGPQVYDPYGTR